MVFCLSDTTGPTMTITVSRKFYSGLLLVIGIVLIATHLILNSYHYEVDEVPWLIRQLFELDEENNIPTWFSSFLLLNCAAILFIATPQKPDKYRFQWLILAAGFLLLAIDEVAGLHESFHTAIDINWTIPAAVLLALVGSTFIPFLLSLPRELAIKFIVAGLFYVGGALGAEWLSKDFDEDSLTYSFAVAGEESLEMFGAWLFLYFNLGRVTDQTVSISFR